jgi:hypothetical protein
LSGGFKVVRLTLVASDLESAGQLVLNRLLGVGAKALNEALVKLETANTEAEERLEMTFDVRCEHACGSASGPFPHPPTIDDSNTRIARPELVGNGVADDPGPDYRDIHTTIVVWCVTRML